MKIRLGIVVFSIVVTLLHIKVAFALESKLLIACEQSVDYLINNFPSENNIVYGVPKRNFVPNENIRFVTISGLSFSNFAQLGKVNVVPDGKQVKLYSTKDISVLFLRREKHMKTLTDLLDERKKGIYTKNLLFFNQSSVVDSVVVN